MRVEILENRLQDREIIQIMPLTSPYRACFYIVDHGTGNDICEEPIVCLALVQRKYGKEVGTEIIPMCITATDGSIQDPSEMPNFLGIRRENDHPNWREICPGVIEMIIKREREHERNKPV